MKSAWVGRRSELKYSDWSFVVGDLADAVRTQCKENILHRAALKKQPKTYVPIVVVFEARYRNCRRDRDTLAVGDVKWL